MIQLKDISLHFGPRHIFDNVNCVFEPTDHIGVIGRNGAGKSMLLKIIARAIQPTAGMVTVTKGMHIGYLAQEEVLSSPRLIFEEAVHAFADMMEIEQKILSIEKAIETETIQPDDLEEYAELQTTMQTFNKRKALEEAEQTLLGLGFKAEMFDQPVSSLSVGWKMRLGLAKLLLTKADFYLFDEPTNHLDIATQSWFLQKLTSLKSGFLLVSHDRAYLDKACTNTLEVERGKATYYTGNLSTYLDQKETQTEIARATRMRQEKDIAQKQATVDRFRYSASKARQAQSLIKKIEKIELVEVEPPLPKLQFKLPEPKRSGSIVMQCNNMSFAFEDKKVFSSLNGEIHRGERVALIAANGVGKSTFIKCLTGILTPQQGNISLGHQVSLGYFEQNQAEALSLSKTIFEELVFHCPDIPELEIRKLLGAFLFSGDDIEKKIGVLSGGEKNRVAMTKLLLQKANFLVLDEPTNHLDLYAKDILAQALATFKGTILFVSHDYEFTQKLATRVIELTPTSAYSYPGTYEDFCAHKQTIAQSKAINAKQPTANLPKSAKKEAEKTVKKRIHELERKIAKLEQSEKQQLGILESSSYGSPEFSKATEKITIIQDDLKNIQQEWEDAMLSII